MALVAPAEHPPAERAGRSVGGRVNGRTNGGLARKAGAPSGPVPLTFYCLPAAFPLPVPLTFHCLPAAFPLPFPLFIGLPRSAFSLHAFP